MSNAFEAQMLAAVYADPNLTVAAVYTPGVGGTPVTIRVQDFRQGVSIGDGMDLKSAVIRPEIWVRQGDVQSPPTGHTLTLDGTAYVIASWKPHLNGAGIATGELRLVVQKA